MTLSWNEIRDRAHRFSHDWADTANEDADAKPFLEEFFNVFGITRRRFATFEHRVKRLGDTDGYIDLLWKGMILVEMKSRGKNLDTAYQQAKAYTYGLEEHELPKLILVSDFQRFRLYDLDEGSTTEFTLKELSKHVRLFGFLLGLKKQRFEVQNVANIKAAERMAALHDRLEEIGYKGHPLEVYLVRILFCLFAEDTGIFLPQQFREFILNRTRDDGSDLAGKLQELFQVLNTPNESRFKNLDEDLADFPYVNGGLFQETLPTASFDTAMRKALLESTQLDWSKISPAIFGSMFQGVMNPQERRNLGAHYTSEANILKVIKPLFLDELRAEFERVKNSKKALHEFHKKLGSLTFLDPACGCGNFLVITYRELRALEHEVIEAKRTDNQALMDVRESLIVNVDQFYGIEFEEFPAQIAQVAMWLIDHQMNLEASERFGAYVARIPLTSSSSIRNGNALQIDWASLLPVNSSFSYILGNPPFIGSKLMTPAMREDILNIFPKTKGAGTLDYVSGWYGLAARYMRQPNHRGTRTAFVSTNSITQGEQVGVLWGPLLAQGFKIRFAYQTFRWNNEAKGVAAVHCIIIGFGFGDPGARTLFETADDGSTSGRPVKNISPYLVEAGDVVLQSRSHPICSVPEIGIGNKPIDGGHYLFTPDEKDAFLKIEPGAAPYFKRWLGSDEFINNWERWCLWLGEADPQDLRQLPEVLKRIEAVRKTRLESKSEPTRRLASTPTRFHVQNIPRSQYLIVPEVSSERRSYIPIGYISATTMASNLVKIVADATIFHFGVLTSSMHMSWVRYTAGRLKSDYRYSKDIVYNNFPWPKEPTKDQVGSVEKAAQGVLATRANHPGSSLADLYDPRTMPPDLVKAHQVLDRAVEKCYRSAPFANDAQRVEFLFELYEQYTKGLFETEKKKRVRNGK